MKRLLRPIYFFAGILLGEPSETPSAPLGFPDILPIANADTSDRHPITVSVPTKLQIAKDGDVLTLAPGDFQETKLTVGKNMATGILIEKKTRQGTEVRSLGMTMVADPNWKPSAKSNTLVLAALPRGEFFIEYTVTLFETDIPAQHIWAPQSGKGYKILWTHTFKELLK